MAIQPNTEIDSGLQAVLEVADLRSMLPIYVSDDELVGLGDDLIDFFVAFSESCDIYQEEDDV